MGLPWKFLPFVLVRKFFKYEKIKYIPNLSTYISPRSALLAELEGVILAIELALKKHWNKVWTERNSLIMVKAFSNSNTVFWTIKSRWMNCLYRIMSLDFMISHIFRECNNYADKLASIELSSKNLIWYDHLLNSIRIIIF